MKIDVDLTKLGVRYDEDGDVVRNTTLEEAIIQAAADRLLDGTTRDLRADITSLVESVARERVADIISEVLAGPITLTTPWGEKTAPTTTVKEIVREALDTYLQAPGRDNYGRSQENLKGLIQAATNQILTAEMAAEVKSAKEKIREEIRAKAIPAAVAALTS